MTKNILFYFLIFPLFIFSQNPYTHNGSYSLSSYFTTFPSAFGLGSGNCGNGPTQTIIINGDLNLNGGFLSLNNVELIVYGNLNGGGTIYSCSDQSTYCVRGAIQNNPFFWEISKSNNCQTCTKTWVGSQSSSWNNASNWSPSGVPTISCDVIINNNVACVISTTNAEAKSIKVSNSGNLTVNNEGIVTVKGKVEVGTNAQFLIENNSSLIQIDNVANVGNIIKKRSTTITKMDYVYWASPVENFNISSVSPNSSLIYKWIPTVANNLNGYGNWAVANNETMITGKGYIVRGPNDFSSTTSQTYTATFVGKPNNGTITIPLTRGTYSGANYATSSGVGTEDDDNWNLIGNPYPSAIDVKKFLAGNTDIDGYVHVWTHNTRIGNSNSPFYGTFAYNYSANDYVKMNATGTSKSGVRGLIGSGQGFFVKMRKDTNSTTTNAIFTNSMRGKAVSNNQFFRSASSESGDDTETPEEKHRIWMNLVAPNEIASSALIGYVTDATNEIDRIFDAESKLKSGFELYSLIDSRYFNIQGKALPFADTDEVPLGYTTNLAGTHTFGLTDVDGIFAENQNIYIQDLELGITHDLKVAPYSFSSTTGKFDNRFVLKFRNQTLSNEDFISEQNIIVFANESITVNAKTTIKEVLIYDVTGRLISQNKNIDSTTFTTNEVVKTNSALIVQVLLENNIKVTTKLIY